MSSAGSFRLRGRRTLLATSLAIVCLLGSTTSRAESPRIAYVLNCSGCHLADGSGTPGKVPALKGRMGLFLRVPGGREFLVQVPGTAQSRLDDAGVASVLNWMLREFSPGELPADFVPYSETEVSRLRRPLTYVSEVRSKLVARFEGLAND